MIQPPPKGFIARSVKPSRAQVSLGGNTLQPTFAEIEHLKSRIEQLMQEKLSLEESNASLRRVIDKLEDMHRP